MPFLNLFIRSPDTYSERQYDLHLTIGALQTKLESVTGIPFSSQRLTLYPTAEGLEPGSSASQSPLAVMSDSDQTLADYGAVDWCGIQVENTDPHARDGEFVDTSRVEKFELTQEEYEKRNDTILPELRARHIGRFAPSSDKPPPAHVAQSSHVVGVRCLVLPEDHTTIWGDEVDEDLGRRGAVRFVGPTQFGKGKDEGGDWIGVELDEPTGKNDGSVGGTRYFSCGQKHGMFVRPERVKVGDYPEVDEFADDSV